MSDKTCETCKHADFRLSDGDRHPLGYCRRNPPRLSSGAVRHLFFGDDQEVTAAGGFPQIYMGDWCGEHTPKDSTPEPTSEGEA